MDRGIGAFLKGLKGESPRHDPPSSAPEKVVILRLRRHSANRYKHFDPLKPSDGIDPAQSFGNLFHCEICGLHMDKNNQDSHLKGKKHNLRKVFKTFDFKTLRKSHDGSSTVALLFEHVFKAKVQNDLPMYGIEFFVECHDPAAPNEMIVFHKASGSTFRLPLFEQEKSEEGEVEPQAEQALKKKYEKFLEDLWTVPLITHSLRQRNFEEYKKASGWPWIETPNDGPHDTRAAWRKLQISDGNRRVKESALKSARNMDENEFRGSLNSIQVVGADELEILKLETEKKVADFLENTIEEQTKPEVVKLSHEQRAIYKDQADAIATKTKVKAMKGMEQIPGVPAEVLKAQRESEKREAEIRRKNHQQSANQTMGRNVTARPLVPGVSGAVRPPASINRWPDHNNFGKNNFQQQTGNVNNFQQANNFGNNFQMRNGQPRFPAANQIETMADLPPPPGLNIDLEEAAKNLTKMGQKLSGGQEKQEDRALEAKEMKLLRDLLQVENELDEKISQVKDLVDREKNIKELDHQPLGKLLSVLDSAKTAIATDYYLLFTKAHLKYRPRTIKIEAASAESFGFRVQQTRVGGKRIFYFSSVTDRSPSAKAGLCQGDRLVELNDKTIDEYDYDELIEKIQTASKPNAEGKKVLIFLLSDPETDEYIQTELALPVIRYQVKPHVNPDSIAKEWLKFRKKQKTAKKGFFTDTSHFETKLELIQPRVKSKPPVSEAQPAMPQDLSDKFISPLPTSTGSTHSGQSRENDIDDVPALNYDRGGERRLLSRIITDSRPRGPPRREGWADDPPLREPSPAYGWNDQSFPPNKFHNNEPPVFDNSSNQSHHQQGWANGQRSRHRSSDQWNHPSRFPAEEEPPSRWNGPAHHHPHHNSSGPMEHTRDFDSRHSHIPPENYNRHWSHGSEANHGQHVGMRPDSWMDHRRRPSHPESRFRPY